MKPSRVLWFAVGLVAATMLPVSSLRGQVSFPGPELLGRPTDRSVTVNVVASAAIQAYFEYGTQAGGPYTQTSPASGAANPISAAANVPLVVPLTGLQPDTPYFYRMVYRQTGTSTWITRSEYSFHTQRPAGSTFTFTVAADSHINIVFGNPSLYRQTLQNIAGEKPDFHLDLGDTFAMDNVTTQAQANSNYLNLRSYFGLISPSVPIFLALGNHEQEEGWHLNDTANPANSPPVMSTNARNQYYLNPDPLLDSFYTGNTDVGTSAINGDHAIEDYYAWQWGDALFVVIDPYWYSTTKPYAGNAGGGENTEPGSGDRWDWTLGWTQYQWLVQTLENSNAKYKFIFAHQVAGGMDDYGRGGANAVPYVEWGGYDDDGTTWDFGNRRSGWDAPIHQLLVKYNVSAFFHAHDHEFAYEKRDGVVYQLVPMPSDASNGYGFNQYHETDPYTIRVLPNSGHLRVTVNPTQVTVDYVRAFVSRAGTNGQVAYSYSIPAAATPGSIAVSSLSLNPTTVLGGTPSTATVTLSGPAPSDMSVTLTNSNPSVATVQSNVTVPAKSTSATFTVISQTVTSPANAVITATLNGSAQATLTVNPAATALASLTLNPTSVVGGSANSTGTVTLNGFPPSTGATVMLLSGNTSAAKVPASVMVPSNATSATFTITSLSVNSSVPVVIAATFNNGSQTATLTVNPPPSFTPVRINSGGPAYTDSLGQRWTADTAYRGGSPYTVTKTITNTLDPTLYKTSRYGSSFSYTITAPAGKYLVTLKFAELYWTSAGHRVFNVAINGTRVLTNFDIFKTAGAAFKAVDVTFNVTSSGTIAIQFTTGSAGNPLVNAIQVVASQ
jgi:hypothetical protein